MTVLPSPAIVNVAVLPDRNGVWLRCSMTMFVFDRLHDRGSRPGDTGNEAR